MSNTTYKWESPKEFEAREDDVVIGIVGHEASTRLFLQHIGIDCSTTASGQQQATPNSVGLNELLAKGDETRPLRLLERPGIVRDRVVLAVLPWQTTNKSIAQPIEDLTEWLNRVYHQQLQLSGFIWLVEAVGTCPPSTLWSKAAFKLLQDISNGTQGAMGKTIYPVTVSFNPHSNRDQSPPGADNHKNYIRDMWKAQNSTYDQYSVSDWSDKCGRCPQAVFSKAIHQRTQRTMEKLDGGNGKYSQRDIIIAIMGATGTGKTNLIAKMGSFLCPDATVLPSPNDSLESGTKDIVSYRVLNHPTHHNNLVFLDTPGFDDKSQSDAAILKMIADWMLRTYDSNGKTLQCILYLNKIGDNRVTGSALRNLKMFGHLCGTHAAVNVIFVTTGWDRFREKQKQKVAEDRLVQYKGTYWKELLDEGATSTTFDNSDTAATTILDLMFDSNRQEEITRLLDELVRVKRKINDTDAARAARAGLTAEVKILRETQQEVNVLLEQKRDALQKELKKYQGSTAPPEMRQKIQDVLDLQGEVDKIDSDICRKNHDATQLKPSRFSRDKFFQFLRQSQKPSATKAVSLASGRKAV